jgi:phage terminase small subunit
MATVESYCVAVGLVREYRSILETEGQIIQTESGPRTHPAFKMLMGAMREARLLAAELGVTPHRRGKVAEEPQVDAWEGMLA